MSSGILYNQEVKAADVNDIARDLGNTSFNGFGTEKFGADELNGITKSLVGKGVLTSDNMCRPVVSDGKVYIQTGTIIFENGAKKVITSPVELPLENGKYIYALNNVSAGTCSIVEADALPQSGDYVALAQITQEGVVKDIAELAKAKMTLYAGNNEASQTATFEKRSDYLGHKAVSFLNSEWEKHSYMFIIFTQSSGDKHFSFAQKITDITVYDTPPIKTPSSPTSGLPYFSMFGNTSSYYRVYYYFLHSGDNVEMYVYCNSSESQGKTGAAVII